ncbi:hypothetical protein DdX_07501 [Ditylenchus destructor]|uniref:Uncharacterized protein n=1 Tax=Ditylenchus destructor TaxID=166010 RepID=A0AAD4R1W9_9BILA|nr:hypothetical protein DdX_07501 [Ditylenchus destructor]
MGGVLSTFGFNQPFFFTLIGIILMLMLTLALVSDPPPGEEVYEHECESATHNAPSMSFQNQSQYRLMKKNSSMGNENISHFIKVNSSNCRDMISMILVLIRNPSTRRPSPRHPHSLLLQYKEGSFASDAEANEDVDADGWFHSANTDH